MSMGMGDKMDAASPWFEANRDGDKLRISAGGPWTVFGAGAVDAGLRALARENARVAEIDATGIESLDTTGAWLLLRTKIQLKQAGLKVARFDVPEHYRPLLAVIDTESLDCPKVETRETLVGFLDRVGRSAYEVAGNAAGILGYLGRITVDWFRLVVAPQRHVRITALTHQIEEVGINALPIVGLLMFLVGIVLAYQGADQLSRFGLDIFTVNALGVGVLRELGVLITAIIIAGRSGSAFTAQIGTMKVNEEIDAMQTMGLNIDDVLILPRVAGLIIALPFLTFYGDIVALIGGAIMCYFQLGITVPMFVRQLHEAVNINTFLVGMIKAPVFAYVIGMVGCYEGLNVERNAASVGRLTTRSVVESVFLVIVLDAGFSVIFSVLGV
ncbi:phospholipid/cholesterol/gamma-HCH transport system permease protein [Rhizomicrobium palustre]|uniref:Phospholipid/cholesterol/gamma-HCH transport system permease protein n=1 Tax=Rhizomicrobium palustre TaxID=189966 RepID=A0A846MW19_9PROT|nr:ABC transporter permease [Rhizomicrobium palustre]NIK87272.1 phospholipid/cholesterol/gamma-HCH transport system permease protein [Rhizomicrobium palustre]